MNQPLIHQFTSSTHLKPEDPFTVLILPADSPEELIHRIAFHHRILPQQPQKDRILLRSLQDDSISIPPTQNLSIKYMENLPCRLSAFRPAKCHKAEAPEKAVDKNILKREFFFSIGS